MVFPLLVIGGIELMDVLLAGTAAGLAGVATQQALNNSRSHTWDDRSLSDATGETLYTGSPSSIKDTQDSFTAVGNPAAPAQSMDSSESQQKSRSRPMASTTEGTEDNCNDCGPKAGSKEVPPNRNFKVGKSLWPYYQLQIANKGGFPHFQIKGTNRIEEWLYKGIFFDGFWEPECTLVEAKCGYKKFFEQTVTGSWKLRTVVNSRGEEFDFLSKQISKFADDALIQAAALQGNMPPARLYWFFSEIIVWNYCNRLFMRNGVPVSCFHEPMIGE